MKYFLKIFLVLSKEMIFHKKTGCKNRTMMMIPIFLVSLPLSLSCSLFPSGVSSSFHFLSFTMYFRYWIINSFFLFIFLSWTLSHFSFFLISSLDSLFVICSLKMLGAVSPRSHRLYYLRSKQKNVNGRILLCLWLEKEKDQEIVRIGREEHGVERGIGEKKDRNRGKWERERESIGSKNGFRKKMRDWTTMRRQ